MALGDAMNVSSPNYPMYYFDNQWCVWYFTKSGNGTFLIEIIDVLLRLVGRDPDVLSIGYGTDITQADSTLLRSEHILPAGTVIMANESYMWMTFISSWSYRQRGFKLEWKVTSMQGNTYGKCPNCLNKLIADIFGPFFFGAAPPHPLPQLNKSISFLIVQCEFDDMICDDGQICMEGAHIRIGKHEETSIQLSCGEFLWCN